MTRQCYPIQLRYASSKGMTLVELLTVIAMIGILAGIAIPTFSAYREKAQVAACIAEIRVFEKELLAFYLDESKYPESLADIGLDQATDPWGHPYRYLKIEGAAESVKGKVRKDRFLVPVNSDFDLYSVGRDGKSVPPFSASMSADDIVRANDGVFVGRASNF